MLASERLSELGIELPEVAAPVAAYVPAVRTANTVFTSGQIPLVKGELEVTGKVGAEVTPEQAYAAARTCVLNAVAAVASQCGGIDNIARILKVVVFVASDPGFDGQPQVGNGASETLQQIFGDAGVHARSAVGVAVLPRNVPVEVELIAEVV